MTAVATKMLKKQIADQGVPEVPEFLEMLHDMGAQMWACQMSFDMMGLAKDDLIDEVEDVINVADFIDLHLSNRRIEANRNNRTHTPPERRRTTSPCPSPLFSSGRGRATD